MHDEWDYLVGLEPNITIVDHISSNIRLNEWGMYSEDYIDGYIDSINTWDVSNVTNIEEMFKTISDINHSFDTVDIIPDDLFDMEK